MELAAALNNAFAACALFVKTNPEGPNWYPCGFAWLTYRCRKNAAVAKTLMAAGFKWDDYNKYYYLSPYQWTNTQSMDYKEALLRVAADKLALDGFPGFNVSTRID